ncbi:MAG: hypothetical protein LW688_13890 [Cryomorphaceae bacterium]|jgi:hypothetical protein|nr:hypothetical protein [Cryomorphaceae bacterium]
MKTKSIVIVQLEQEGFHNYPDAPTEVKFLRDNHRHTFRITLGFEVTHNNREKEIFLMRDEVRFMLTEFYGSPCEFGSMSCEMIAQELLEHFEEEGAVWVEVWEENTGGARVEK